MVDSYLPCTGPVTDAAGNTICYGDQDLHIRFDAGFKIATHANGGDCEWAMQRIVDVGVSFFFSPCGRGRLLLICFAPV